MAKLIQAINLYGPKVELNPTAKLDQVVEWMATFNIQAGALAR